MHVATFLFVSDLNYNFTAFSCAFQTKIGIWTRLILKLVLISRIKALCKWFSKTLWIDLDVFENVLEK